MNSSKNNFVSPSDAVIPADATLAQALSAIEMGGQGIVGVLDKCGKKLCGILTDGDVRRVLMAGGGLTDALTASVNKNFAHFVEGEWGFIDFVMKLDEGKRVIPVVTKDFELLYFVDSSNVQRFAETGRKYCARCPVRISFAGGGSDLLAYFRRSGYGAVFSASINLYANTELLPLPGKLIQVKSVDFGTEWSFESLDQLGAESSVDDRLRVVFGCLQAAKWSRGISITIWSDFRVGSGLGGSSAVALSILSAINECYGGVWSEMDICALAFKAERVIAAISGGWQDYFGCSAGGFNLIEFRPRGTEIHGVKMSAWLADELERSLILVDLEQSHDSGKIHLANAQIVNSGSCDSYLHRLIELAVQTKNALTRGDIAEFGQLLHDAWLVKQSMGTGSGSSAMDDLYSELRTTGVLGGKVLGAGFGGYFLLCIDPRYRFEILRLLEEHGFSYKFFRFDFNGLSSWVVRGNQTL